MTLIKSLLVVVVFGIVLGAGFLFLGIYPMGADVPHYKTTTWALTTLRERSVARASRDINVPPLENADLLLAGGPDYNEMCASCHLKPGVDQSDLSIGLYPQPPNLVLHSAEEDHNHGDLQQIARRQFWIIKHGIKASGMPAWGPTHNDERIWAMVAFLQKLPELTPEQYQILTARDEDSLEHH